MNIKGLGLEETAAFLLEGLGLKRKPELVQPAKEPIWA